MGFVAVQQPTIRRDPKEKPEDPLDRILKGLQIASSVYGIKSSFEQSELNELRQKQIQQGLKREERKAGLEAAGIMPSGDFNKEYRAIDQTKLSELENKSGFTIEPINVRVEDPASESGFIEKLAISKEDLKDITSTIKQKDLLAKEYDLKSKLADDKKTKVAGEIKPSEIPKEASFKAYAFSERMANSNNILNSLEEQGFKRSNNWEAFKAGALNALPMGVGETLKGEDLKSFEQAKRDFVNATLRRESGAAISPSEFESAEKQYFPVAGDTQKIIDQKRLNREIVLRAMALEAGPVYSYKQKLGQPTLQAGPIMQQPTILPEQKQPIPITQPETKTFFGSMFDFGLEKQPQKPPETKQEVDNFINSYLGR